MATCANIDALVDSKLKYAISSPSALTYGVGWLPYIILRNGFEKIRVVVPLLDTVEDCFNSTILRLAKSTTNGRLIGVHLFDAVELHMTDPRMFYNHREWKKNLEMIKQIRGPISSFHAHVESSPIFKEYAFNLSENTENTRKAIRSQLETAYLILHDHSAPVKSEHPVFVFHAGVARNKTDMERAFHRTRENIEYIAMSNQQLYEAYGRGRKLIPTIENSPRDKLSLCQTVDDWRSVIIGFQDEVKLTLDYGHLQTLRGETDKLFIALEEGEIGADIVSLHLHYSPEINNEIRHAHAALSKIPKNNVQRFQDHLAKILEKTAVTRYGYITLEVGSEDPFDYVPALEPVRRYVLSLAQRLMRPSGMLDWATYRGTIEDTLASLRIVKRVAETQN